MATEGGNTGWGLEYSLTQGETAAACCPTGFTPSFIETLSTYAATCINLATSTSFSTVVCDSGNFKDFSLLTLPNNDMKTFTVYAPLIQLNFQASDLPATTSSQTSRASTSGDASPSSTGQSLPSSTANPSTTSDPVASLVPSSLRSSGTASSTSESSGGGGSSSGSAGDSDDDSKSSGSSMTTGAKVGIGVGVGVGVIALIIVAFFIGRSRRKEKKPGGEDEKRAAASTNGKVVGLGRQKSIRAEMGGDDIVELPGNKTQELPATALSVGSPRQPAAIFELEADNPSTLAPPKHFSRKGDTLVSPVTPTRPGAHSPVSPVTPTRPSHESTGPTHESNLRNEVI
ncbi:hypothetical protein SCUP515_01983 [Seiridium cupressi]